MTIQSNKILIVVRDRVIRARLRSWGDVNVDGEPRLLYWRSRRYNGHVALDEEGRMWIRGWQHDKQELDALWAAAALSR